MRQDDPQTPPAMRVIGVVAALSLLGAGLYLFVAPWAGLAAGLLAALYLALQMALLSVRLDAATTQIDALQTARARAQQAPDNAGSSALKIALEDQSVRIDALVAEVASLRSGRAEVPVVDAEPDPPAPVSAPEPEVLQPELPMLDPPGDVELNRAQIVRALNFPETADDRDGFDLFRRALARRDLAEVLQSAEDCLNFLAQGALYMDDLLMAPATADDWRAFAKGGRTRAALLPIQGVQDEAATVTVRTKMRTDPIFRDAALVFQRRFDNFLGGFAGDASDDELLALMDSRSGRAFILFAQVNGSLE